ncbi:MAG: hypothetical protein FWD92_06215 [Methanomassiliicoccaceae archaeon]|nr:hypothetical protein [Methanomassiliicoccaceae archaeon]
MDKGLPGSERSADISVNDNRMTFWNWLSGPHPVFRAIMRGLGLFIVLVLVAIFVHWVVVLVSIASLIIAHFAFRHAWFEDDGVQAILLDSDRPGIIDPIRIGRDLYAKTPKNGSPDPKSTSLGVPIYIIEKWDEKGFHFSWIHQTSAFEFLSRSQTFNFTRELAADSLHAFRRVRDIPEVLGECFAEMSIRAVEEDRWKSVMTLDPTDPKINGIFEYLQDIRDPLKELKKKYFGSEVDDDDQA